MDLVTELSLGLPVLAAPMAGGPTTPALVIAARQAGSFGFLAAGYADADAVALDVAEVQRAASCGVNLFAPAPVPVEPAAYREYAERLRPLAERYRVELPRAPREDDDQWHGKIDVLTAAAPEVVSFTFGLPDPDTVWRLHRAGCLLAQTVTSVAEARAAVEADVDLLVVQAAGAGGHSGTFTPSLPIREVPLAALVAEIRAATTLPLLAGGGVGSADDVRAALAAGATAVSVGTLLLLADEAGTSAAYRAGLTGPDRGDPVLTHAYSGRPARGLRTEFLAAFDGLAPLGYPALHHLTTPIRRAAAVAGDPENINLWAGTGYRHAVSAPVAAILKDLV